MSEKVLHSLPKTQNPDQPYREVVPEATTGTCSELLRLVENVVRSVFNSFVEENLGSEVEKIVHAMLRKAGNEIHPSESRSLRLKFMSKISAPVDTGMPIKGEDTALQVALVDALTAEVVRSGPEASAKVEIVVLDGKKIVMGEDGKNSLLGGFTHLNLEEGTGSVGEIYFRHTKHWMRSREFKLGARLVDLSNGTRVRMAMTESFTVKDRRAGYERKNKKSCGEVSNKRDPPSLSDEVWRLKNIRRNGPFHKRLSGKKIETVKDFLSQFRDDRQSLLHILGPRMHAKMWEETLSHAQRRKPEEDDPSNSTLLNSHNGCNLGTTLTSLMHGPLDLSNPSDPSFSTLRNNPNGGDFGTADPNNYPPIFSPDTSVQILLGVGFLPHINGNMDHVASTFTGQATNNADCDPNLELQAD